MTKSLAFSIFRTNYLRSTFRNEHLSHLESVYLALIGGCRWIQLSMNDATDEEIAHTVRQLKVACEGTDAVLTLEGHVELAQRLQVDGVYLTKKGRQNKYRTRDSGHTSKNSSGRPMNKNSK